MDSEKSNWTFSAEHSTWSIINRLNTAKSKVAVKSIIKVMHYWRALNSFIHYLWPIIQGPVLNRQIKAFIVIESLVLDRLRLLRNHDPGSFAIFPPTYTRNLLKNCFQKQSLSEGIDMTGRTNSSGMIPISQRSIPRPNGPNESGFTIPIIYFLRNRSSTWGRLWSIGWRGDFAHHRRVIEL